MREEVQAYYDGFRDRLVRDFEYQNIRVVHALAFAEEVLAPAKSILDVGCGIGWSTAHLRGKGHSVTGLDISPVLIETAREIFGGEFICADFTEWWWEPEVNYDAVLFIDSYEHFAREARPTVHARIRALDPRLVALTVPSEEAMQYARDHGIPLQPIDEDVTPTDLATLAHDLGGEVVIDQLVSVWEQNDYRHVLVER